MSRRQSAEVDRWRARALVGDALADLTDAQREWVWRSLLKGVRLEVARTRAGLSPAEVPVAVARVREVYARRLQQHKEASLPLKPST